MMTASMSLFDTNSNGSRKQRMENSFATSDALDPPAMPVRRAWCSVVVIEWACVRAIKPEPIIPKFNRLSSMMKYDYD